MHSTGFYKGREILHTRIGTKETRGSEVANAVCSSYITVTFHRFYSVFHSSLLALTLNNFLCDDLFCFCKPILSRAIVGFDLCYPFFMLLLDISCVLLSYVTSYNI